MYIAAAILFTLCLIGMSILYYYRPLPPAKVAVIPTQDDREELRQHISKVLRVIIEQETAKLPPPKFKVGDQIRVFCKPSNFHYGWECLCEPFKPHQDEEATVLQVTVNTSHIEEMCEDFTSNTIHAWWRQRHHREICLADSEADLIAGFQAFLRTKTESPLYYSYQLQFENPTIKITWPLAERFLAWPLAIQHA